MRVKYDIYFIDQELVDYIERIKEAISLSSLHDIARKLNEERSSYVSHFKCDKEGEFNGLKISLINSIALGESVEILPFTIGKNTVLTWT